MYYLLKYYDRQGNTSKININNINKKERHVNTVRIINSLASVDEHQNLWNTASLFLEQGEGFIDRKAFL